MIRLEYQILIAVALDLLLGDPRWLPHPVRLMGWLITRTEALVLLILGDNRPAGAVMAVVVIALCAAFGWGIMQLAALIHPLAGGIVGIMLIYLSLAARDMVRHSEAVRQRLVENDLPGARKAVGMIVSRDAEALDEAGVCRSAVESVAENLVDGVISPLLFAAIAGPVGAVTFKAISTLDSMVGYKNERYLRMGWASARLDDLVNFVPARLTAPLIAIAALILKQSARHSLGVCIRDHDKHSSPNSAWSEAAFAGAMGIQLGGPTTYNGKTVSHPTLGDACYAIKPVHIRRANSLFVTTVLIATGVFLAGRMSLCWGIQALGVAT